MLRTRGIVSSISLCLSVLGSAMGADLDLNGLEDSLEQGHAESSHVDGATVAMIDTGDHSIVDFTRRFERMGISVTTIPLGSGIETLDDYPMVLLPVDHGLHRHVLGPLAPDYHQYVAGGGCLYITQPNDDIAIPWAPYDLVVERGYDYHGCDRNIEDPEDCSTANRVPTDLPYPFDTAIWYGGEWEVLVTEAVDGRPGLLTASYGAGHAIVDLGNPNISAFCPFTDEGLEQMTRCCIGDLPTPVVDSTWGRVKISYRAGTSR